MVIGLPTGKCCQCASALKNLHANYELIRSNAPFIHDFCYHGNTLVENPGRILKQDPVQDPTASYRILDRILQDPVGPLDRILQDPVGPLDRIIQDPVGPFEDFL